MFASRVLLLGAKTAVKETTKKKKPVAAVDSGKKVKAVGALRDASKPPLPVRYSLPNLISLIPQPAPLSSASSSSSSSSSSSDSKLPSSQWQHKNGWGLKFYRAAWAKYPEPSYWTVTRCKPKQHGHKVKLWGILTWRGVTEQRPREITGCRKREWKYLAESDFKIPFPHQQHPVFTEEFEKRQQQRHESTATPTSPEPSKSESASA